MRTRVSGAALLLLAAACTQAGNPVGPGSNRAPVIGKVTLSPSLVPTGGEALVEVEASDPDGDAMFYRYTAEHGSLTPDPQRPERARYLNDGQSGFDSDRIQVMVTDTRNAASTFTANVALQGNRAPELRLPDADPCHPTCRGPGFESCRASCTLNFLARVSDPEGQALTYEWQGCVDDSNGPRASCHIGAPGLYAVTLIVRDARGAVSVATAKGEGVNRAPDVSGGLTVRAAERRLIIDVDEPDGDPVRCAWRGTCQCTGDGQSYNQSCSIPAGVGSCIEVATCFDPFGALGETQFQMVRP